MGGRMPIKHRPQDRNNPEFDNEASIREARARLPLERVIESRGFGPSRPGETWKSFQCPFCQQAKKAGIFEAQGDRTQLFKCYSTHCSTGTKAMDAVGFIALRDGLSSKDAFVVYLKEAGVWKERTRFKRDEASRAEQADERSQAAEQSEAALDEELIANAIAYLRAEGRASIALLQRRLRVGYSRGAAIMDELERRGVVGPAKGSEPRELLIDLPGAGQGSGVIPAPDASEGGSAGPAPAPGLSDPAAAEEPEEASPFAAEEDFPPQDSAGAATAEAGTATASGPASSASPDVPHAPSDASLSSAPAPAPEETREVPTGWTVLRRFYARLSLSEGDIAALEAKRGLTRETILALGFRSNPKSNADLLHALLEEMPSEALLESGLFKRKGRAIRPNAQFYGFGPKGKKKKPEPGQAAPAEEDGVESDWEWDWTHQVLIPYVDEHGDLIGLRPHKGNGESGTVVGRPKIYVPRAVEPNLRSVGTEFFPDVVITEGEFKAAALWQVIGAGSGMRYPKGVVALPGISMWRHYELREELDAWLIAVGARKVRVAFDNEEKGDPKLPGYKADPTKRHDAQIYARALAEDLYRKLHIAGLVCHLPDAWRDEKGKADWDGALARFRSGTMPQQEQEKEDELVI